MGSHGSHVPNEVIDRARVNNIHLITTHILQPLDVGVFKSFKTIFSKACTGYLAKNLAGCDNRQVGIIGSGGLALCVRTQP